MDRISVVSVALTATSPPAMRLVLSPMLAVVVFVRNVDGSGAATPAVPPTEPPIAMSLMSSLCDAVTVTPPVVAVSVSLAAVVAVNHAGDDVDRGPRRRRRRCCRRRCCRR